MRIVAVYARHGALRQLVGELALEAGPNILVAGGAQLIDIRRLAGYHPVRTIGVNRVAPYARHLVLRVTAVEAAHMRGLIKMAGETELVGFRRFEFRRVADIGGIHRFRVFTSRSVARFAGVVFETALLVGFYLVVRVLLKSVENVFVAALASCRAHEFSLRRRGCWSGSARFVLCAP